jgi:protein TonB
MSAGAGDEPRPPAAAIEATARLHASAQSVAAAADQALLLLTGEMMVRPAAAALPAGLARSMVAPVVPPATAPKLRRVRGFTLAMALHVAALGGLFLLLHRPHRPPPPEQDVIVEMAMESAPATGAAPATKSAQKPPPLLVVQKPTVAPMTPPSPHPPVQKPAPPIPRAPALARGALRPASSATAINVATIPAHPDDDSDNPPPDYPLVSRDRGEEGVVVLSIHVLADGLPGSVAVEDSSGYPMLDDAARDAVLRWHFAPAFRAGVAVDWMLSYRILFQLQ